MNYIQKLFSFFIVCIKKLVRLFFKKKIIDHVNWYEAKPVTFNKRVGHEDFRKGNYRIAFRKYAKREDLKFRGVFDRGLISRISIYLYGGLGDNIQFLRFVKVIKEKYNSYISILVEKKYLPLYEILERLEYIDKVCLEEKSSNEEIFVSLKSLPYLLDIGLDNLPSKSYINIYNYPISILGLKNEIANNKFKVGIHWSTGKTNGEIGENSRNINLNYFQIFNRSSIKFYSLEKQNNDLCKDLSIIQIGESRSLLETELIIKNMNLIITTDTAIAHLSGAVGVETWILLPHPCPSWRYYINEHSTPWYPQVRLVRQTHNKNWSTVFEKLNEMLNERIIRSGRSQK